MKLKHIINYAYLIITSLFAVGCDSNSETPVFADTDFELCVCPLPEGYPNSWTHASIEYVADGFNGYKYFFACSPYPNYNDDYENPMFFYANAREGNLPPTVFTPFKGNPLQEVPKEGFNADPDVIYLDSMLYVTNRPFLWPNMQWVNCQRCYVDSGSFCFKDPVTLYDNKQTPENFGFDSDYRTTLQSPSVVKYKNELRFYQLASNSYNNGTECRGVVILQGKSLDEDHGFKLLTVGSIEKCNGKPWHIDVFPYQDKLYAIICACVHKVPSTFLQRMQNLPLIGNFVREKIIGDYHLCYQYLAESEDGINFSVYKKPLTTINTYRSSAVVREDGLFVMYVSTLKYKPEGNVSEDGRNIMLTYKPFEEVLKEMRD